MLLGLVLGCGEGAGDRWVDFHPAEVRVTISVYDDVEEEVEIENVSGKAFEISQGATEDAAIEEAGFSFAVSPLDANGERVSRLLLLPGESASGEAYVYPVTKEPGTYTAEAALDIWLCQESAEDVQGYGVCTSLQQGEPDATAYLPVQAKLTD